MARLPLVDALRVRAQPRHNAGRLVARRQNRHEHRHRPRTARRTAGSPGRGWSTTEAGRAYTDAFARVRARGAHVVTMPRNGGKRYGFKTGFRYVRSVFPGHDVVCTDLSGRQPARRLESTDGRPIAIKSRCSVGIGCYRITGGGRAGMTGLELIVAALAAGASAGVTNTATTAIQDAYTGLKGILRRWLASRAQAQQALEADEVEPGAWQTRLGDHLTQSGADHNEDILTAARQLLTLTEAAGTRYQIDLREAKGVQVGDQNTQHNTFS